MKRRNAILNLALGVGGITMGAQAANARGAGNRSNQKMQNMDILTPDTSNGNINHSVCRWCYGSIPLDEFCQAARAMGLTSIDLLGVDDFPTLKKYDLVCAMVSGVPGGITSGLWESKHLGDKTALIGTPFYAPVEQFGGDSPDVRSDVYNVATVLYELCTGVVPWPGKSFLEVFQSKLQSRPPRMTERAPGVNVPAALEEAIVGGLIAEARDRYASAEEFAQQLEAARL